MRTARIGLAALAIVSASCRREPAAGDGPYAREVADAIPRIELATGLKFKAPPKVEVRTREQVRDFLLKKFDEATPAKELAGEETAYKLLGLIPDSMNLRAFFLRVLSEQVVGYYDPAAKTLYVVNGADEQTVAITITHELVHALQDQYVNLDSLQKAGTDNDRLSAAQALVEGEAQFEQLSIMVGGAQNIAARLPGGWERIREEIRNRQSEMPVFATAPMVIQESLLFPYLSGAEFVHRMKDRKGNVNLFADIPRSTEQILHAASFSDGKVDEPTSVTLPAPRGATKMYENDMGEFGTRLFLYQFLKDPAAAARAAAGWDGDKFMVVEGPSGKGIVWALVWDSALEAAEFSDALTRATARRTGAAERNVAGGGATFAAKGRTVSILPQTIGDRALVLYTDLPDAMPNGVVNPAAITLGK
ncbi:MAG: hypothetical protein JWL95_2480 [Gemmatimonadetes bacterium]|nr:hypothetical protein [Gemmatimonadota bacterium]